jgi:MFS transporter, FSR family, fosmidomycin resistance protein
MQNFHIKEIALQKGRAGRAFLLFTFTLLTIEFLDELVFGTRESAWPLIRDEFHLSYSQIGLLLSIPLLVASVIEPLIGILADVWRRRFFILGGGITFTISLALIAYSYNFPLLMAAFILIAPSSGAFVSLSQAALMDSDPDRREQNMARWTLAGSLGIVIGSLSVGTAAATGVSWRVLFAVMFFLSLLLVIFACRLPFPISSTTDHSTLAGFRVGLRNTLHALKRREVLRWLLLLVFSDFMLDVLHGFIALYFVDVVGTTEAKAAMAVLVWTGVGLIGDILMLPLLERVQGLRYLRFSAFVVLFLLPLFLLLPGIVMKLLVLGLLGMFNAGWYSILKANLYSSMPGQSGTVITLVSLFSLVDGLCPLLLGIVAEHFGLATMMWLLLLGPIALLIGIPLSRK